MPLRKFRKLLAVFTIIILLAFASHTRFYHKLDVKKSPEATRIDRRQIAVVVVACNRALLRNSLDSIVRNDEFNNSLFDFYVSLGCENELTLGIAKKFRQFKLLKFPPLVLSMGQNDYYKVAHHYKQIFTQIFDIMGYETVIVLEDDLELSKDALTYFLVIGPLMNIDPSIFCLSIWNDNGYHRYSHDPLSFHLTNFFPGLGWMWKKHMWDEVKTIWPPAYWDDFLRQPKVMRSRHCIYPEVSRVRNIGSKGVSGKGFYNRYVRRVVSNSKSVDYSKVDPLQLLNEIYYEKFMTELKEAKLTLLSDYRTNMTAFDTDIKIGYKTDGQLKELFSYFDIVPDSKYGVHRTSYENVLRLNLGTHRVFIFPHQ